MTPSEQIIPYGFCHCGCGQKTNPAPRNFLYRGIKKGEPQHCLQGHPVHRQPSHPTHGHTIGHNGSRTYLSWSNMKQRCLKENNHKYSIYGARGITVCERWLTFVNFLEDMGECPAGLTIERIDNNGNYEPGNCKWATRVEQQNNRRVNRRYVHNGISLTLTEISREVSISVPTLSKRLSRGLTIEQALVHPYKTRLPLG